MGKRRSGAAALFLAAALAGDAALAAGGGLAGTEWNVATIAGTAVPDGVEATLSFGANGRAAGSTGCNRLVGTWSLDGETLTFGPAGTTMMACPDAQMRTQERYVDALEATRGYRMEDVRLILLDGSGAPLMTLTRASGG